MFMEGRGHKSKVKNESEKVKLLNFELSAMLPSYQRGTAANSRGSSKNFESSIYRNLRNSSTLNPACLRIQ